MCMDVLAEHVMAQDPPIRLCQWNPLHLLMSEDFGSVLVMADGHIAVYCHHCHSVLFEWVNYLNHVNTPRHQARSTVIVRRRQQRRDRRAARLRALKTED